jgi:hypothetical protein
MFPADIGALASRYLVLCTPCLFLTTAIAMLVVDISITCRTPVTCMQTLLR